MARAAARAVARAAAARVAVAWAAEMGVVAAPGVVVRHKSRLSHRPR